MKRNRLIVSIVTGLILAVPFAHADRLDAEDSLAHADNVVAMQLAGPPADFATMFQFQPVDAAIYSKSALLPIELSLEKAGGYVAEMSLPVERDNPRFVVFTGQSSTWKTDMRSPSGGSAKSAHTLAKSSGPTEFGMGEGGMQPAEYYTFEGIERGYWMLQLASTDAKLNKKAILRKGMVLIEGDSNTLLVSYQTHMRNIVGERIGFTGTLSGQTKQGQALHGKAAGSVDSATLRVTTPSGVVRNLPMHDDGQHSDAAADDGIYGGDFLAEQAGEYNAQVVVHGTNLSGYPMVRSAEHMVPVLEPSLHLSDSKAIASIASDAGGAERLNLNVPVAGEKALQHYRGYAEVWGTDSKGAATPVAWVSGMVTPHDGVVSFGLDTRWIALADAQAPFELRRLRLEDPDVFIKLAGAERLPMTVPTLRIKAKPSEIVVDNAMQRFAPPAAIAARKGASKYIGYDTTLLVHGYCSSDVWNMSHFTPYVRTQYVSKYQDFYANRSIDQFGRGVAIRGYDFIRMSAIAHSQGGMAALHAAWWYSDALWYAEGGKIIQAMQTPWGGTNIAGVLATLGKWVFGVGCGSNSNLSYSGAQAWRAGIPTAARITTTYITSSNHPNYANCNFATSLVLSDPEDGVVERNPSQLYGAYSDGHAYYFCHSTGMNGTAGYTYAPYNATMASRAAY